MKNPVSLLRYGHFVAQQAGGVLGAVKSLSHPENEFKGYPSNHCYSLANGRIYPGVELFERWRVVRSVIPEDATSMLDMACCRGFYLLQAMRELAISRALGVDVNDSFLRQAEMAASYLGVAPAFIESDLSSVVAERAGLQMYDVVLLTGAYHYFYWCDEGPNAELLNHEAILGRLAKICRRTLIISARLEVEQLPACLRQKAAVADRAKCYKTERFVAVASRWFDVAVKGRLGRYPLYVLTKRD